MQVSGILSTKPSGIVTSLPEQSIKEAIALMAEHNIGALIILNEAGKLVGILSERDVVRKAVTDDDVLGLPIREVMTTEVVTATPQDGLMSVAHTMTERRFRHMPVVDHDGNLIGMISIGDVLKAQRDQYRGEIDTLETQIMAEES